MKDPLGCEVITGAAIGFISADMALYYECKVHKVFLRPYSINIWVDVAFIVLVSFGVTQQKI